MGIRLLLFTFVYLKLNLIRTFLKIYRLYENLRWGKLCLEFRQRWSLRVNNIPTNNIFIKFVQR
jgi:hypothetical protein